MILSFKSTPHWSSLPLPATPISLTKFVFASPRNNCFNYMN